MDLSKIRQQIDRVDAQIAHLITRRMEYAVRTKRFKADINDSGRAAQVVLKAKDRSRALFGEAFAEEMFKLLIAESCRLQALDTPLVAFQGEHGAYSEVALSQFNKDWVGIPCMELAEIVENLEKGAVDYGIVAIDNSVEGSVSEVQDVLIESNLTIQAAITMPIRHCLLTLKDVDYREIKEVYSSPRALSQCHGFLKRHKLEPRPYADSASAALMLLRNRPTAAAAIASSMCARLYDLEILKEDIQEHTANFTRYLVLSRAEAAKDGDRCSIAFETENKAGALLDAMSSFSKEGINLMKLESRPKRENPGQVAFLLDFHGSVLDPKIASILESMQSKTKMFRMLGCYKETVLD